MLHLLKLCFPIYFPFSPEKELANEIRRRERSLVDNQLNKITVECNIDKLHKQIAYLQSLQARNTAS